MESSTDTSDLALLERAELAARERRLSASAEADRILAAGREQAAQVSAGEDARVAEALERLRVRTSADADGAIRALDQEAAARRDAGGRQAEHDPAIGPVVDLVVAAVLGESTSGGE